jgi:D-glutamate cyclase
VRRYSPTEIFALLGALDPGRGMRSLAVEPYIRGDLETAAQSIANTPGATVVIVTGFFVPTAESPAAETDGPLGAALLASILDSVGIRTCLVTDDPCAPVVRAARDALPNGHRIGCSSVPYGPEALPALAALAAIDFELTTAVSHLVFIERPGPNARGQYCTMRGLCLENVAPLERLLRPGVFSVGIGDGGNEIGMGKLRRALLYAAIPGARQVACVVPTDTLIVSGTSNWGACSLIAAIGAAEASWKEAVLDVLDGALMRHVIEMMVAAGAVDGISGQRNMSVDGLPWDVFMSVPWALSHVLKEA